MCAEGVVTPVCYHLLVDFVVSTPSYSILYQIHLHSPCPLPSEHVPSRHKKSHPRSPSVLQLRSCGTSHSLNISQVCRVMTIRVALVLLAVSPLVSTGIDQGIMRCKKCRTYINPFVGWLGNGRQWRCNVCGMVNEIPTSYMCHLDQNGVRTDKAQRPELSQASVELVRTNATVARKALRPKRRWGQGDEGTGGNSVTAAIVCTIALRGRLLILLFVLTRPLVLSSTSILSFL